MPFVNEFLAPHSETYANTSKKVHKIVLLLLFLTACNGMAQETKPVLINDTLRLEATLQHKEDFGFDLKYWVIEQMPEGKVFLNNGKLEILDTGGCTIWFDQKLSAPLMIQFEAIVIREGGEKDRVSDLNCFWLASGPDNFFEPEPKRTGLFKDYDNLQLYYVGLGGHDNTKTRFRRYVGDGTKPLLPEHDISKPEYLITPNTVNHITIITYHGIVQYYRNNSLLFNFFDSSPYTSGYFGFRTVNNHMTVDNFRVYTLVKAKE